MKNLSQPSILNIKGEIMRLTSMLPYTECTPSSTLSISSIMFFKDERDDCIPNANPSNFPANYNLYDLWPTIKDTFTKHKFTPKCEPLKAMTHEEVIYLPPKRSYSIKARIISKTKPIYVMSRIDLEEDVL